MFATRTGESVNSSISIPELADASTSPSSVPTALAEILGNFRLPVALLIVVTPKRSSIVGVRSASIRPGTCVATYPEPSPEPAWKSSAAPAL